MSEKVNENYNPSQDKVTIRDNVNPKSVEKNPTPPPPGSNTKSN